MVNPIDGLAVFPLQNYPIADPKFGLITLAWSRLLTALWNANGGGVVPVNNPVIIRQIGGGFLGAYDATTGELIGIIPIENAPGGDPQPVVLGASPEVYTSVTDGTLTVFGALVEINRGGTWRKVSLTGGSFPLKAGDALRATWYGVDPPEVTWYPDFQL